MFSVVKSVNNNVTEVVAQDTNFKTIAMEYHNQCRIHWSADDVIVGWIAILDESLDIVNINGTSYKEFIFHEAPQTEEPTE